MHYVVVVVFQKYISLNIKCRTRICRQTNSYESETQIKNFTFMRDILIKCLIFKKNPPLSGCPASNSSNETNVSSNKGSFQMGEGKNRVSNICYSM